MNFQQTSEPAIQKAPLAALAVDLRAVAHKLRYPMADILAKVPGDTLAERARNIGVSRQTMYVWAQERFRPGGAQAADHRQADRRSGRADRRLSGGQT